MRRGSGRRMASGTYLYHLEMPAAGYSETAHDAGAVARGVDYDRATGRSPFEVSALFVLC